MAHSRAATTETEPLPGPSRPGRSRFIGVHIPLVRSPRASSKATGRAPSAGIHRKAQGEAPMGLGSKGINNSNSSSSSSRHPSLAASGTPAASSSSRPFVLVPAAASQPHPKPASTTPFTSRAASIASTSAEPIAGPANRPMQSLQRARELSPPFMPFRPAAGTRPNVLQHADTKTSSPRSTLVFGRGSRLPSSPFDRRNADADGRPSERRSAGNPPARRLEVSTHASFGRQEDPVVIDSDPGADGEPDSDFDLELSPSPYRPSLRKAYYKQYKNDKHPKRRRIAQPVSTDDESDDDGSRRAETSDSDFVLTPRRAGKRKRVIAPADTFDSDDDDDDVVIVPKKRSSQCVSHAPVGSSSQVKGPTSTSAARQQASRPPIVIRLPATAPNSSPVAEQPVAGSGASLKARPRPRVPAAASTPNAAGQYEKSTCHQCRLNVTLPKMVCDGSLDEKCSKRFCSKCLARNLYANHPQLKPDVLCFSPGATFACPRCLDVCPCASCRDKRNGGRRVAPASRPATRIPKGPSLDGPRKKSTARFAGSDDDAEFPVPDHSLHPVCDRLAAPPAFRGDGFWNDKDSLASDASESEDGDSHDEDGTLRGWLCVAQGSDGKPCVYFELKVNASTNNGKRVRRGEVPLEGPIQATKGGRRKKAPVTWTKSGLKIRAPHPPTMEIVDRFKKEQEKRDLVSVFASVVNGLAAQVPAASRSLELDLAGRDSPDVPLTPSCSVATASPLEPNTSPPPSELESDPPMPTLVPGDDAPLSPAMASTHSASGSEGMDAIRRDAASEALRPSLEWSHFNDLSTAEIEACVARGQEILAQRAAEVAPTVAGSSVGFLSGDSRSSSSESSAGVTVQQRKTDVAVDEMVTDVNGFAQYLRGGRDAWLGMEVADMIEEERFDWPATGP